MNPRNKSVFTKLYLSIIFLLFLAMSCGEKEPVQTYTCPMHPQVVQEGPGQCPICHMDLVLKKTEKKPGQSESSDSSQKDQKPAGKDLLHVSGEYRQLSGIRTTKARMGEMVSEIETTGRAAFDPELGVAVKEYLLVIRDPSLASAAR
jgi:Cu(I)/Ag(I) efflux system membrane fusion protein